MRQLRNYLETVWKHETVHLYHSYRKNMNSELIIQGKGTYLLDNLPAEILDAELEGYVFFPDCNIYAYIRRYLPY